MMETILQTTLCVSSTICLWSAFLLAYDWQGVTQRRWLSLVLFLWGLAWGARACGLILGVSTTIYGRVLAPELILVAIVAGFTFLVWPLTVLSAPKVGPRKFLAFCTPFLLCAVIYYGAIWLFDLPRFDFSSLRGFWSHIVYFSVWFRLVMCMCLVGYLFYTIRLIIRYINDYNRYVEDNYSEYQRYTIKWMPKYLIWLVVITVAFFVNLCFASYATFVCHNVVACVFLAWLAAKVLVYNSPYSSVGVDFAIPEMGKAKGDDFNSKFDSYTRQIKEWMVDERPYLSADFNLKDVMTRFGLNRTYASKIFNDGFGKSFILVVRDYRIEYARKVIESNPAISMAEVAGLCGYSTAQAFHKAFVYCNDGVTPGRFAQATVRKSDPEPRLDKVV